MECPAFPKTLLEEFPEARGEVLGLNPGSEDNKQLGVCGVNPQRKDNEEAAVTPCFVPNYSLYLITLHFPAALPRGWAAPRAWQQEGQSQPQNPPGSGADPRVPQTFLRADWEAGTAPNWCDWGWLRHRRPLFTWLQNAALFPLFSCTGFLCNSAGKHLPLPPHPPPPPIPNYTLR